VYVDAYSVLVDRADPDELVVGSSLGLVRLRP
jgi:hypothetical protein